MTIKSSHHHTPDSANWPEPTTVQPRDRSSGAFQILDVPVSYASANDVPVPLRHTIVALGRKGMKAEEIAARFDVPLLIVRLFVDMPVQWTEH